MDIPRFTGSTIRGRLASHFVRCSRTRMSGGITIIGVAFSTRETAVSPTANVAALRLLPKLCVFVSVASTSSPKEFVSFSSASCPCTTPRSCGTPREEDGKTSIPRLISSPRIKNTFNAPALATAANGTNRVSIVRVEGDIERRRGTKLLRP